MHELELSLRHLLRHAHALVLVHWRWCEMARSVVGVRSRGEVSVWRVRFFFRGVTEWTVAATTADGSEFL